MKRLETVRNKKNRLKKQLEAADKEERDILKQEEQQARREEEKSERLVGKLVTTCAPPNFYGGLLTWLEQNEATFIRCYTYRGVNKTDTSELEALRKFLTERAKEHAPNPVAE